MTIPLKYYQNFAPKLSNQLSYIYFFFKKETNFHISKNFYNPYESKQRIIEV